MQAFVDRHGLSGIPHIADESGVVWERFGVLNQPAWVFIDDSGGTEVVFGRLGEGDLGARLDALAAS